MKRRANFLIFASLLAFGIQLYAARIPNRYIVEFNTPSVAQKMGRRLVREGAHGAAANAHRSLVRTEQQQGRSALPSDATELGSVNTVANAMFVEIPDAKASQLSSLPNVRAVHPMRTFHMILDQAVQVNKVADAWSQVGIANAGAGIKIAIIDSGIDVNHPGFQDPSLTTPASFPKLTYASDSVYTNSKVIVARSYVRYLDYRDPDYTCRDHVGHGTALAMVSAGVQNAGPLATIQGVAPKAYLGNYKVFGTPGWNDSTNDAAIITAIEDAVSDGMDVINLSIGSDFAPRLSDDIEVEAIEAAYKAGVIVVVAAGNNGPDADTLGSPATAPSAIAAGASHNSRTFAASVTVDGLGAFVGVLGDAVKPSSSISGAISDVSTLDGNGLGCQAFAQGSLSGTIAFILRGTCTFEAKLKNAQAAGAIGAIIYAAPDSPDPISMYEGSATLPAEMISNADGAALKQALATQGSLTATLGFAIGPVPTDSTRLASFSAAGPGVDYSIKPEIVAVGEDMYVATQTYDPNGDMYDRSGYITVDGTSFSTPMIAGAVALLKAARPGLTTDQYRSLIINNGTNINNVLGQASTIQQSGGGALNLWASLNAGVTVAPATLGFGAGANSLQLSRTVTISNTSTTDGNFTITVVPSNGDQGPTVSTNTLQLAPGASTQLAVSWSGSVAAGGHEGFITITGASTGVQTQIPYWYDALSDVPARITILSNIGSARRRSLQYDALLFRITDSAGVPITDITPVATVTSGGGVVAALNNYDSDVPGLYSIDVRLGAVAGANMFHIQAGDVSIDAVITGQ